MKSRKKNLRMISLVLAIVFVASVCVFADPDSREQPNRAKAVGGIQRALYA